MIKIRRRIHRRLRKKKMNFKKKVLIGIFEIFLIVITFPMMLLYGPFENVKRAYVGAAMGSMTHQYLATWFLSDEEIKNIIGESQEAYNDNTDVSEINITKNKDSSIELYAITDNPKYDGYYLVVKDSTRIKIGVTSKLEKEGETTSEIAENNNAVAAINGGAFVDRSTVKWTGTGAYPDGIVMSDGKVICNSLEGDKKTDLFGVTKEGVLIVGQYSAKELKELNVKEALSFGPVLIINGKMTNITSDGGVAPRTAIGQKADGSVILLVIDGRSLKSYGATYTEVQEIMYKLGAVNAINLDGGRSTTMYYNGEIINTPSNSMGERPIPTAVVIK